MLQKPRTGYGRSRVTPRANRRSGAAEEAITGPLAAARRTAAAFVAARWPELAEARPTLATEPPAPPSAGLLARLGLADAGRVQSHAHYTFTFYGERKTADGHATPLVVVVTVDDAQRIVKTSVSH